MVETMNHGDNINLLNELKGLSPQLVMVTRMINNSGAANA